MRPITTSISYYLHMFQNASEFMVVQTSTALASGQFSEKLGSLEAEKSRLHESLNRTTHDYGRLLELSENLTQQLEDKSLSFIQLEKNYHVRFCFLR